MPVVMEVAHQRDINAHTVELLTHVWHSLSRLGRVDGDANHLGARYGQLLDLNGSANRIDGVSVSHRLNAYRRVAAYSDDARAPHNFGLTGFTRLGLSDFNRIAYWHYFTSNRATLSLATAFTSNTLPRIST